MILVSGFDERVRHAAARLAGAVGLQVMGSLTKPVMAAELAALLGCLPERSRAGRRGPRWRSMPASLPGPSRAMRIDCYYQPKLVLATRRVLGLEVLARWRNAPGGFVPPDQFIPLAEREG